MTYSTFSAYLATAFLTAICSLSLAACQEDDGLDINEIERQMEQDEQEEQNSMESNKLPLGQGHLRVLAIGNSFSDNSLYLIKDVLKGLNVNDTTYSVYGAAHTAASLQHWVEVAEQGEVVKLTRWGGKKIDTVEGTLPEILSQMWDVIILLQYSLLSTDYYTFNPWLNKMEELIKRNCPNPHVALAWQMSWSYKDYRLNKYTSYERWLLIAKATKEMLTNDGIDILIPVGTAIQNARNTTLNTIGQLTNDGWHLNNGVPRYIAACAVVQTLFAPVYGINISDDRSEIQLPADSDTEYPPIPVTEENRTLCHQCVKDAITNPFKVMQ